MKHSTLPASRVNQVVMAAYPVTNTLTHPGENHPGKPAINISSRICVYIRKNGVKERAVLPASENPFIRTKRKNQI